MLLCAWSREATLEAEGDPRPNRGEREARSERDRTQGTQGTHGAQRPKLTALESCGGKAANTSGDASSSNTGTYDEFKDPTAPVGDAHVA